MKQWRKVAIIPALISALALTACAGAQRPSVEEIKQAFHTAAGDSAAGDPEALDQMFECIAKELHGSEISDKTLSDMVKDAEAGKSRTAYSSEEEKELAEKVASEASEKCLAEVMGKN
ncbi:hypothetical protein [uncultured Gulosibacter sp.]|uniref:hypothetical protein n=1 Tax=uncultured Gulosibacter sp. TaxID=1339167 RepID=UPI00288BC8C3|nr:hypothetical protein [uncultured Gulosibacter sp.]